MRSKQRYSNRGYIIALGAGLLAVAIAVAAFASGQATIFGSDTEPTSTPAAAATVDDTATVDTSDSAVDAEDAPSPSDEESQPEAEPDSVTFANCMRANGIPEFPDPQPSGGFFGITPDMQQNPNFPAAQEECTHLRPEGRAGGGEPADPDVLLAFAQCMRENGVPEFPDPATGGGMRVQGGDSGLDTSSPQFQVAIETCIEETGLNIQFRQP